MREQLLKLMGGRNGGTLITGTDAVTGEWDALVVNEAAVIAEILVDGVNVTTSRGFASKTLTAGMFLSAGANRKITSIDLTSGSVIMY